MFSLMTQEIRGVETMALDRLFQSIEIYCDHFILLFIDLTPFSPEPIEE